MRLSLRFILPLLLVLGVVAYSVVPLVDSLTLKWFTRDLESRSKLLASTMEVPLADLVVSRSRTKIFAYFHKVIQDERLYALGFCDTQQRLQRPPPQLRQDDSQRAHAGRSSTTWRGKRSRMRALPVR